MLINAVSSSLRTFIFFAVSALAISSGYATNSSEIADLTERSSNLYERKQYAEARRVEERIVALLTQPNGRIHPDLAYHLFNLARLCDLTRDDSEAERRYQQALNSDESLPGSSELEIAIILDGMGDFYRRHRAYQKAIPRLRRALSIREKKLGENSSYTGSSVNNLALLYEWMGSLAEAEVLYRRSLNIAAKTSGAVSIEAATCLNNLALCLKKRSKFAEAEPLFRRALNIRESRPTRDDAEVISSLNNLANLYLAMDNLAAAEPLLQRAFTLSQALDPQHLDIAVLGNLGWLHTQIGDYNEGERLFRLAIKNSESASGDEAERAVLYNNMGWLYWLQRKYAEARPWFKNALVLQREYLKASDPEIATTLNNLGALEAKTNNFKAAESYFKEAITAWRTSLGTEHPDVATGIEDLGALYRLEKHFRDAEQQFKEALRIREKTLGPEHSDTIGTCINLAYIYIDLKKTEDAQVMAARVISHQESLLNKILSFTSEQQRLSFQRITDSFSLIATVGDATAIAQSIMHNKGIVLDSLLEDRLIADASKDPTYGKLVARLRSAKARYTQLSMELLTDLSRELVSRRQAELEISYREATQLESDLARQVSKLGQTRRALTATIEQVQRQLEPGRALVELIRFKHYDDGEWQEQYGAIVIAEHGKPKWVPLGAAVYIARNVSKFQRSARGLTDETALHDVLRDLYDQLWSPIAKALPSNCKTVYLSPDGELNFVSFATLLSPEEKFVVEQYSLRYVTSGRDLLREDKLKPANSDVALFGNPDFNAEVEPIGQPASPPHHQTVLSIAVSLKRDFGALSFPMLSKTEDECTRLAGQFSTDTKPCVPFLGSNSTEARLRALKSPYILHLATHGFFLPDIDTTDDEGARSNSMRSASHMPHGFLQDPMNRSGVALAGAQRTLNAWAEGTVPSPENDGIVTAEEVGGLHLENTWLVTLSACDTGAGEARAGEGVLGLRRGFIQAGARNLLFTLWPIKDNITAAFMAEFYAEAQKSGNPAEALCTVQKRWLVRLSRETGLQYSVQRVGPFLVNSLGKD